MKTFILKNYYLIIAALIFLITLITKIEFYKVVILLLEFIVILEVVKMVSDFIENQKVRLRFIIDMFIIFLIRDVVILSSYPNKRYDDILFLLFVIFVFFIFRVLALYYSPTAITKRIEKRTK
jgi:uncharacterized membrane protein (DUF373 family)